MKPLAARMKNYLLHMFFPNRCPFCDRVIEASKHCCSRCEDKLVQPETSRCVFCGETDCRCAEQGRCIDYAVSAFFYEDQPKQAMLGLKYHGKRWYAEHLAWYLAEQLRKQAFTKEISVITFVPMSAKKQKKRGYNQAELLARALGEELSLPVRPMLQKIKETGEQHTLSARQRKYNLVGAYDLLASGIAAGERILLTDDVLTTGNTMRCCADVLKSDGAERIYAAAICKVRHESHESV